MGGPQTSTPQVASCITEPNSALHRGSGALQTSWLVLSQQHGSGALLRQTTSKRAFHPRVFLILRWGQHRWPWWWLIVCNWLLGTGRFMEVDNHEGGEDWRVREERGSNQGVQSHYKAMFPNAISRDGWMNWRFERERRNSCAPLSMPPSGDQQMGTTTLWTETGLQLVRPSTGVSREQRWRTCITSLWRWTRKSISAAQVAASGQTCSEQCVRPEEEATRTTSRSLKFGTRFGRICAKGTCRTQLLRWQTLREVDRVGRSGLFDGWKEQKRAVFGVVSPCGRRPWFSSWVKRRAGTNPVVRAFLRLSSCAERWLGVIKVFLTHGCLPFLVVRERVASPSSRLGWCLSGTVLHWSCDLVCLDALPRRLRLKDHFEKQHGHHQDMLGGGTCTSDSCMSVEDKVTGAEEHVDIEMTDACASERHQLKCNGCSRPFVQRRAWRHEHGENKLHDRRMRRHQWKHVEQPLMNLRMNQTLVHLLPLVKCLTHGHDASFVMPIKIILLVSSVLTDLTLLHPVRTTPLTVSSHHSAHALKVPIRVFSPCASRQNHGGPSTTTSIIQSGEAPF